tara:strand:- start:749 stop:1432 length:684 start_codon:yes stop_codon:yes gene_type:complete
VNRPTRKRGVERFNLVLDATETLLSGLGDEDISLAQIAQEAQVSLASVYYFFPNRNAVFVALAERFNQEIYRRSVTPLTDPEPQSWQELLDRKHASAASFQNSRPAALRLFLGAGVSVAVRNADFQGNARVAQSRARMLETYFDLPRMPELAHWIEISAAAMDGIWALSYGREGRITEEYRRQGTDCTITYLRRYLPEFLPRRTVTEEELSAIVISDIPAPEKGERS